MKYVIVPRTTSHSPNQKDRNGRLKLYWKYLQHNQQELKSEIVTYQERLPIIPGKNIITLDETTKVSIYIDSESILKNYIPDNAILQVAPQTTIKYIARSLSNEHVFQAIILDRGNIPNIHSKNKSHLKPRTTSPQQLSTARLAYHKT